MDYTKIIERLQQLDRERTELVKQLLQGSGAASVAIPQPKRRRRGWTAAQKAAMGRRMKADWSGCHLQLHRPEIHLYTSLWIQQ
jgi:hypothetical protein